jgi:Domain of unknown function (DUF397)
VIVTPLIAKIIVSTRVPHYAKTRLRGDCLKIPSVPPNRRFLWRGEFSDANLIHDEEKARYMLQMEAVVVGADWRKASYSVNNGACVEVASAPSAAVMVRDSVDPSGPVVSYPARTWQRFLATAKADAFSVVR